MDAQVKASSSAAASARLKSWKLWASTTAMQNGARLAHRFSKVPAPQPAPFLDSDGELLEQQADAAARPWHSLWASDRLAPPIDFTDAMQTETLGPPTAQCIRAVANSFSSFTAVGNDHINPHSFAALSDDALSCIALIMTSSINSGTMPTALSSISMALLPKPSGGWRTIGIFTTIVRVFMRWTRRHITDLWEGTFVRPGWFGQRGRTCQQATWTLSLAGEFAQATGQAAASALIDLEKAYEHINHEYLWKMAIKHKFNLRLLRFVIRLYQGPRIVMANGIATNTVYALSSSVVAGCAHAAALMKLTLVDSLDYVAARWPAAVATVVVDDTQFQMVGRAGEVRYTILGATADFKRHVEDVAGMKVSVGKLEVVTNSPEVADAVRRTYALRHALRRHTRNLGVDYACGRTIKGGVVKKRLRGVRLRLPMLRRLRAAGARASSLVATGLVPAMVYGSSVIGMRPSELKIARAIAHAALHEHTFGRSVDLDMMIENDGADPAFRATIDVVLHWKAALLELWAPRARLLRTMLRAIVNAAAATCPFADWACVCSRSSGV